MDPIITIEGWDGKSHTTVVQGSMSQTANLLSSEINQNGIIIQKEQSPEKIEITALEKIGDSKLWGETKYTIEP